MKISLNWLNSYLDRPTDAAEAERVLTDVGFPLDGVEQVNDDTVLDVEVTSNRPDCLSHLGVARELAAATGRTLREPQIELPSDDRSDITKLTSVDNQAADLCPQYIARLIRGVKVAPSPPWMRQRLEAIGLRSVNNVVDVTNYVLHELGQPLHAFDMARLAEHRIVVRRAAKGEPFTAIDGSRHTLRPDMLVIADASRPVAIAGVMGGLDSEVSDQTTDILLESAQFNQLGIRSASRALKLASDSSYRFERGVDPAGVELASRRAMQLMLELAGGELAQGSILAGKVDLHVPSVPLRLARCRELLGIEIPAERIIDLLARLGLQPRRQGDTVTCTIPSHRLDLRREVDLIEEIARLHGLGQIPVEPTMRLVVRPPQKSVLARNALTDVLVAQGYHQTVTFSFLPPAVAKPFADGWELVQVDQEKKRAEPALRPSILPSLLQTRKSNQDAGNRDVKLFEIAQVFGAKGGQYVEHRRLALLADAENPEQTMRSLRGTLEEAMEAVGAGNRLRIRLADAQPAWTSTAAKIMDEDKRVIGMYGPVNDATLRMFDLQTPVVLAELLYDPLIAHYPPQPQPEALPRFPAIERDLSVVVDEPVTWSTIELAVHALQPPLMEQTQFVTVYRGKPVPPGRKSVTFRMTFRDPKRTLQHDEVSEQVNAVVAKLKKDLNAELRA